MRFGTLVWAAIVLASLAAGAVVLDWFDRNREGPDLIGRTLIGRSNLAAAGIVLIETASGQVTLRRTPLGWIVVEADGFAADMDKIRTLLLRMASTSIAQRVPIRPDHLGDLGLLQKVENNWEFEAGKTASVLSVIHGLEQKHRLIYQVLIGNRRREGTGTYVRFPVSNSAYLIEETVELDGRAEDWIERRVFGSDAQADMRRIRIHSPGASPLVFARAEAGQPWRLAGAGTAADPARVQDLALALATLRLKRVSPRKSAAVELPQEWPSIEVNFVDGHVVELALQPQASDAERQAALHARAPKRETFDAARWEVEAFNYRFETRMVALDAAQSGRLLQGRDAYRAQ